MEVMKRSYLLLDGAGNNSVLIFSLIDGMEWLVGMGWNGSLERDGIARRQWNAWNGLSEQDGTAHQNRMEPLVGTGWNGSSERDGTARWNRRLSRRNRMIE